MTSAVLTQTDLPGVKVSARGKVRDIFPADGCLVMVASDRISAFDCILGSGIPLKGKVLTQLSIFWFDYLKDVVRNHFLSANPSEYPEPFPRFREQLEGRSMLVKAARPIPIECVVRGYLAGSCWKQYQATRQTAGILLPAGLRESDRLAEPLFTPASKATSGHDENISFAEMGSRIGRDLATRL